MPINTGSIFGNVHGPVSGPWLPSEQTEVYATRASCPGRPKRLSTEMPIIPSLPNIYKEPAPNYAYSQPYEAASRPNNYYQRMAQDLKQNFRQSLRTYNDPDQEESSIAVLRTGRQGSNWRHIKQCTGNLGNHICFVDGTVKIDDIHKNPPWGYTVPEAESLYDFSRVKTASMRKPSQDKYISKYNDHAKQGFKYWYQDKKPMSLHSRYSMGSSGNPFGIPGTALPPIYAS